MDLVSTLLENNINQAIMLNKILVKNEEQINNICEEQKEIETKNSMINNALNSWSSWWLRIWSSKQSQNIRSVTENEKNMLDIENKKTNNNTHIKKSGFKDENNLDDSVSLLSKLANRLSENLDRQNEMLDSINEKNISLDVNIQKNQNNIDNLI